MNIGKRLQFVRGELNQEDFGSKIGITKATVSLLENGKRPLTDRVIRDVCREFNVSEAWLRSGEGEMFVATSDDIISGLIQKYGLKEFDRQLIMNYSKLPPEYREAVKRFLYDIMRGQDSADNALTAAPTEADKPVALPVIKLVEEPTDNMDDEFAEEDSVEMRVYYEPATAGYGYSLDPENRPYATMDFPADSIPFGADFGVRIKGDSMEPDIMDGDIVWVKSMPMVENGQIGIFALNGNSFCKVLRLDFDKRTAELVSLNKKYSPIVIEEEDVLYTIGRVLPGRR